MGEAPTHNERILAGALMVILCTKAMDGRDSSDTEYPSPDTMPRRPGLMKMAAVGYRMMGIDPGPFLRTGVPYSTVLKPAIHALYDKFAIVEQVMDS
jgi:hypothetical protein